MKASETAGGMVLFLFGALTALLSLQLPIGTLRGPGSGLFPLALGLLLMGLAAGHLFHLHLSTSKPAIASEAHRLPGSSGWRVLLFMGAVVLATAFLTVLGYPLAAFLLMAVLLYILGVRRWQHVALIALGAAGASYVLFVRWLQIPLPKGWIGL